MNVQKLFELIKILILIANYIKSGTGAKAARKIFANVKFDAFENDHVKQLLGKIKQSTPRITFPQRLKKNIQNLKKKKSLKNNRER